MMEVIIREEKTWSDRLDERRIKREERESEGGIEEEEKLRRQGTVGNLVKSLGEETMEK